MRRHQLRTAVGLCAATVTLSACTDRSSSAPTSPVIPRVNAAVSATGLTTLTCDINALKAGARDFTKSGSDPLFKIIGDLPTAVKNGSAAATDKAYDGLARLAAIRGTGEQKVGVAGAVFDGL